MKFQKALVKLALLSSLALSFGVKGDGTLPLPIDQLPLELEGSVNDLPGLGLQFLQVSNVPSEISTIGENQTPLCNEGEDFFEAKGTLNYTGKKWVLSGICKPRLATDTLASNRTVIAADGKLLGDKANALKLVKLQGKIATPKDNPNLLSSMEGIIEVEDLLLVPRDGEEGIIPVLREDQIVRDTVTKQSFKLVRIKKP